MLQLLFAAFEDKRLMAMFFAAIAAGATVITLAMPFLSGDGLEKRMAAVATERYGSGMPIPGEPLQPCRATPARSAAWRSLPMANCWSANPPAFCRSPSAIFCSEIPIPANSLCCR